MSLFGNGSVQFAISSIYQEKELSLYAISFSKIRTKFGRKSIYTDGAYWYNDEACKWLRLRHIIYGTDSSKIPWKRFIQQIKDRTDWMFR
jgi:hypothetical protein